MKNSKRTKKDCKDFPETKAIENFLYAGEMVNLKNGKVLHLLCFPSIARNKLTILKKDKKNTLENLKQTNESNNEDINRINKYIIEVYIPNTSSQQVCVLV